MPAMAIVQSIMVEYVVDGACSSLKTLAAGAKGFRTRVPYTDSVCRIKGLCTDRLRVGMPESVCRRLMREAVEMIIKARRRRRR